jgi:hypothetical protein
MKPPALPELTLPYRLLLVTAIYFLIMGAVNFQGSGHPTLVEAASATLGFEARHSLTLLVGALLLTALHGAGYIDFTGRSQRAHGRSTADAGDDDWRKAPMMGDADSPYDAYGNVKALSDD